VAWPVYANGAWDQGSFDADVTWIMMTDMSEGPNRRWFRLAFSLRTFFVVVTVAACGVGVLAWKWHRRYERIRLLSTPDVSYMSDSWGDNLGLESVREIDVGDSVPDAAFERMKRVFPEAEVRRGSGARLPYHLETYTHR